MCIVERSVLENISNIKRSKSKIRGVLIGNE